MKPNPRRLRGPAIIGLCLLLLSIAARAADKQDVISKARAAYYSLKSKGLVEFQCNLKPDWELILKDTRKADPAAADRAIQTLNQLQFGVSLGTSGSARVTHSTVSATSNEMAKNLDQIYSGVEQMLSGFFDTWTPFMVTSPLPAAKSDYQLEEAADHWNLSYKEGTADVATTLGKDLAIRQLKVTTADFRSTILPQFTRGRQGLLITGYEAEYYGKSPADATKLHVGISYQQVNELELPQKLSLAGSYGGSPFQVEVTFYGCSARKQ